MIAAILKLTTLNADGLHAPGKRVFTSNSLLQEGHDIIALQEIHCENNDMYLWGKEWPGLSKWNTYSTRSAGVAILFNPKLNVENNRYSNGF